ncbi:deacetylvindoline O-acetyltransferase-like [Neltuma alba]|uniref:deacetylvindoline O-acetyltransferase-like n=1 Tax=Neltuma alba TaxID=207710 RepID=UPI0010A43946|nr:deacetylvindoline O-acetyltransferase-like [Prosopis alba]
MKVELVSKQIIKPSSPTPKNLRTYKLSFIDQLALMLHTRMLFFYPNIENKFANDGRERLKTSLSETLTHFYPFAGRVKDNKVIECNDEGVEFCETRVHGFLSYILKQPDADFVHQFVPVDDTHLGSGFLMKVQVNLFDCGGLAIDVSFSHKIADASTIDSFIKAWSCTAIGCMTESMLPKYVMESHFPSMEFSNDLPPLEFKPSNCITRRYVFESSEITKLKARASSKVVEQPTRVEAVLALIWKCATTASRINLEITKRPSKVFQAINVRKRTKPPLPETSVGNCFFVAEIEEINDSSTNMDLLQTSVVQLRQALELFSKERAHELEDKNNALSILSDGWKNIELAYKEGIDFYMCSSWCRFEFYEADFGWGKPKWVSIPSTKRPNGEGKKYPWVLNCPFMNVDGMTLSEQNMAFLERNQELLDFASLNPAII